MAESLIQCPKCGSDACYKLPINESAYSYFCFGCGFQTNDLQKLSTLDVEAFEETLPELYKDIKYVDSEDRIWYPITINLPSKGTVFMSGRSKDAAEWCGIQARPLTEEEQESLANKGHTHKSDSKTLKNFGKDFIEALDYIGFFNKGFID